MTLGELRTMIRISLLDEGRKKSSRVAASGRVDGPYGPGNDDTLMLDHPGTIVEPDVRKKISKWMKAMGLIR